MSSRKPNSQKINTKHSNQVRIIGGELRGRKIQFPSVEGLRPTPDSVRERLFNWLGQDLAGQTVLDLFSGSGALGFEAVSRYAKQVVMCEINRTAASSLKNHAQQFGVDNRVYICQQNGLQFLAKTSQVFDIVLLDPPFAWQGWADLLPLLRPKLAPEGYLYIEASALPEIPDWLCVVKQGRAGQSLQLLLQPSSEE